MRELVISKYEAGQRFDKFLAKYMELAPKSFFYKMMRKKNITLNGKKAAGNEKLEEGNGFSPKRRSKDSGKRKKEPDIPGQSWIFSMKMSRSC